MKKHDVFYGTRAEFAQRFGVLPPDDVVGVCFTDITRTNIVFEFIFTDDDKPTAGDKLDIAELERMFALTDDRGKKPITEDFLQRYGLERT